MATMFFNAVGTTLVGAGLSYAGGLLDRRKRQGGAPAVTFGQRVEDIYLSGSSEGAPIRKLWGRMRLGGNMIWVSNFTEWTTVDPSFQINASAGKGGGGGGQQLQVQWTVNFHYNVSFAVAFCEGGEGTSLGTVWADGKELDLSQFNWRFYNGADQQLPDTHIESIEGAGAVPAYRGICYLVFEAMDVSKFGNRVPQITAEIIRRPVVDDPDDVSNALRSLCLIPGSGEFVYGTRIYTAGLGPGNWQPQNGSAGDVRSDLLVSLDILTGASPAPGAFPPVPPLGLPWAGSPDSPTGGDWKASKGVLSDPEAIALVVSWFGSDLRAGNCQIRPRVEVADKNTTPADWEVAGYTRRGTAWFYLVNGLPVRTTFGSPPVANGAMQGPYEFAYGVAAQVVSQLDPSVLDPDASGDPVPAFGGTPSDNTVVQAIQNIKARGLRCVFYPFVMMDIPPDNTLPNPYSANATGVGQPAFPWRGRITCSPAPGFAGSVDKTSAAATQIDAFFDEYDVMLAHYAYLCVAAGGVDAFIIGSELVGLTSVRASAGDGTYPAIARLKALAATVRAIVGPGCKIGYAADWSEYHSHRPSDGTNDVIFNMDPLWTDANIDFIGIDNYLPVSDWRDVGPNADGEGEGAPEHIYDKSYLQSNIEGGEYFDWHYANDADRTAQSRTPIIDTGYGKHWVFRQKDIRAWWSNAHKSRPSGVENPSATAWTAGAKPIWFTEFGCPAIDKGTNQPNVFVDPKSSESFIPYFSTGGRDDAIQRNYLEAMLSYWRDNAPTIGSIKMVEPENMFAWCWDARPFPDFPAQGGTWRDGYNYELGHWLTGRLTEVPLKWIVSELCASVGVEDFDTSRLIGPDSLVLGAAAEGIQSPRDLIAGLNDAFQFDVNESGGKIVFTSRIAARTAQVSSDDFVIEEDGDVGYSLNREQETDLPAALSLSFIDAYAAYASGSVSIRKDVAASENVSQISTPAVLAPPRAAGLARAILQTIWTGRETGEIKLPPSKAAIDPGDCLSLSIDGVSLPMQVKSIDIGVLRSLSLVGFDPSLSRISAEASLGGRNKPSPLAYGPPIVELLDIPIETGEEPRPHALRVAAFAAPWAGVTVYRWNGESGTAVADVGVATPIGELTDPLYSGPRSLWDNGNSVYVQFYGAATLLSKTDIEVFDGANAIAVKNTANGEWEIVQFATAELIGPNKYRLSKLLRGQLGTEAGMSDPTPAGARVVLLNAATLATVAMNLDQISQEMTLRAGPATKDPGDDSYFDYVVTPRGVGLRPWSPSHVSGRRAPGSDDVEFAWKRRTRFAGDAWDPPNIPLNEEAELYDLEIRNISDDVLRTVSGLSSPTWTYSAADQTADWGAPQNAYPVRVYQRSAQIGRGQASIATINL